MKRALVLFGLPLVMALAACGGWFAVDGFDAAYVDAPSGIEGRTRYAYHGGYVYEGADGRYYRQYQNRWVAYRQRPSDLGQAEAGKREAEPAHPAEHHEEQHPAEHHEERR